MGRRTLLAALILAAPLADAAGSHALAFWALALALPCAAACALVSFGEFVDRRGDAVVSLQALLWIPALVLLLAAAAARGPAIATAGVPRVGVTALAGCAVVLALKVLLWAGYRGRAIASSSSWMPSRSPLRAPVAAKPARS